MLKLFVTLNHGYECRLDQEDEAKVREYAEKENCSLEDAVEDLWDSEITAMWDSTLADENLCTIDVIEDNEEEGE